MLNAIETYLALRRAAGFAMSNAEYLLKSFAAFAAERAQTHVQTQTAIDWAALGPSVAQRDARLKAVCRFVCHIQIEDARHAHLADEKAFAAFLAPLKRTRWFVYSKRPFAGPKAVLAYLARYTHRVAISNSRLIAADAESVTFKAKDYRVEGPRRYTTMTLASPTVTVRVPL